MEITEVGVIGVETTEDGGDRAARSASESSGAVEATSARSAYKSQAGTHIDGGDEQYVDPDARLDLVVARAVRWKDHDPY